VIVEDGLLRDRLIGQEGLHLVSRDLLNRWIRLQEVQELAICICVIVQGIEKDMWFFIRAASGSLRPVPIISVQY
jgi:hypothetical protein